MSLTRILQSLPMKKQTVVKSLLLVTLLFIVYQLTFVAELSESAKPKSVRSSLPKHDKNAAKKKHPNDTVDKNAAKENVIEKSVDKNIKSSSEKNQGNNVNVMKDQVKQNDIQDSKKNKKTEISEGFVCRASGKTIAKGKVNDDYCDCPEDGSDEPQTNACTNGKFSCQGKEIPSAWVNDGICDCCDGSDEWQKKNMETIISLELQRKLGSFLSPCPVRCRLMDRVK